MSNDRNYNIEDTGALMTSAKGKSRTVRVVLIVIAIILVAAIALIGVKKIGDKRYDDQIAIADKAFVEGDYVTAEAEYLKAVEMNKRKPKARESLAYTYAIQSKTEESVKLYEELYEDMKEEKYKLASDEVSEGRLPLDSSLAPAQGIWRRITPEQVPYYDALQYFVFYLYGDWSDEHDKFESNNIGEFSAIKTFMRGYGSFIFYSNAIENYSDYFANDYEHVGNEDSFWFGEWVEGVDPKRWGPEDDFYEQNKGYYKFDADKTDALLKLIFNISEQDIEHMLSHAETEKWIYKEDGYYYCVKGWPKDVSDYEIEITDAWTDGTKYCIQHDKGYRQEHKFKVNKNKEYSTYYALVEAKPVGDKHYWSIYYNGQDVPKDVATLINSLESPDIGNKQGKKEAEETAPNLFAEIANNGIVYVNTDAEAGTSTSFTIGEDGSISGFYSEPYMSPGVCAFSGRFVNPKKTGEYEYRFTLKDLKITDSSEIGAGIEPGLPYGLSGAEDFIFYMHGADISDLPSEFANWANKREWDNSVISSKIQFNAIYNVNEKKAFAGIEMAG